MPEVLLTLCLFAGSDDCARERPSPWWRPTPAMLVPSAALPSATSLDSPVNTELLERSTPAPAIGEASLTSLGGAGLLPLTGGVDGLPLHELDAIHTTVVASATVVIEHADDGGVIAVRMRNERGCNVALNTLQEAAHGIVVDGSPTATRWRGVVREHRTAPSMAGCLLDLGRSVTCGSERTIELRPED